MKKPFFDLCRFGSDLGKSLHGRNLVFSEGRTDTQKLKVTSRALSESEFILLERSIYIYLKELGIYHR